MKKLIFLLLVCTTLFSCRQLLMKKYVFTDLHTSVTAKHVRIPGTRMYIIPPKGFNLSRNITGIQKGKQYQLEALEFQRFSYYNNEMVKMDTQGSTLRSRFVFHIRLNEYPCRIAVLPLDSNMTEVSMVFGDSTFCVMISSKYPDNQEITDSLIESLKSIYYDKTIDGENVAHTLASFDPGKFGFELRKTDKNMLKYQKTSPVDNPLLLMSVVTTGIEVEPKHLADLFRNDLHITKAPEYSGSAVIDGRRSYEEYTYGAIDGNPALIYQRVIPVKSQCITLKGIYYGHYDKNLEEIKELVGTFKFK
jgi:hypothetical protein